MTVTEGWYVLPPQGERARTRYNRWVLGEIRGMVRYSKGGTQHFMCKVETFQKWLRRTGAKLASPRNSTAKP